MDLLEDMSDDAVDKLIIVTPSKRTLDRTGDFQTRAKSHADIAEVCACHFCFLHFLSVSWCLFRSKTCLQDTRMMPDDGECLGGGDRSPTIRRGVVVGPSREGRTAGRGLTTIVFLSLRSLGFIRQTVLSCA